MNAALGILGRKLDAAKATSVSVESGAKAWKQAFARAARDRVGLDMTVESVSDDRRSLAELLDSLPEQALLAVLDGPESSLGLIVLSSALLAAVIEMQTIGRLSPVAPMGRRPTRTDAAMSAPLVDAALAGLELALLASPDLIWTAGFRYASFLEEARPLGLLLEDIPYRLLSCALDIGSGARQGQVILALPAEGKGPRPVTAASQPEGVDEEWQAALGASVMESEVTLHGVIGRLRMPLGKARGMRPGMLLPLGDSLAAEISIVAAGGQRLAVGRLGQHRGMRALKINPSTVAAPLVSLTLDTEIAASIREEDAEPMARRA